MTAKVQDFIQTEYAATTRETWAVPYLLRMIRKSRWLVEDEVCRDTVEIPADPLADMSTTGNDLSLWVICGDNSNLDRIVAALAARRDNVSNLDFALIDVASVDESEFTLEKSDGGSKDSEANSLWHRDIKQLSGHTLLRFTEVVFRTGEFKRYQKKRVLELLSSCLKSPEFLSGT